MATAEGGSIAAGSTEAAATANFAQAQEVRMTDSGIESSDSELDNGTTGQPQQTVNTPQPSVLEQMNLMMKSLMQQQMDMFKEFQNSSTEKETKKTPERQTKQSENRIELKSFYRMDAFSGLEANYKNWSSNILTTAESVCPGFQQMVKIYMEGKETGWITEYADYELDHAELRAKEFQNLLCALTDGEAQLMIRNCKDGLESLHKLWQTYNRNTLGRSLRKYKDAIIPQPATHAGEVIMRITEWEAKVRDLNVEEGVNLDPMIMLATLTEICTPEIRDMVY